jgi:hypothetical protein
MGAEILLFPNSAAARVVSPKAPRRLPRNVLSLVLVRNAKLLRALEPDALTNSERQQDVCRVFMALHDLARKGQVTGLAGVYTEDGKVHSVLFGDLCDDRDKAAGEVLRLSATLFGLEQESE